VKELAALLNRMQDTGSPLTAVAQADTAGSGPPYPDARSRSLPPDEWL